MPRKAQGQFQCPGRTCFTTLQWSQQLPLHCQWLASIGIIGVAAADSQAVLQILMWMYTFILDARIGRIPALQSALTHTSSKCKTFLSSPRCATRPFRWQDEIRRCDRSARDLAARASRALCYGLSSYAYIVTAYIVMASVVMARCQD